MIAWSRTPIAAARSDDDLVHASSRLIRAGSVDAASSGSPLLAERS
jgi:hypothetical protein